MAGEYRERWKKASLKSPGFVGKAVRGAEVFCGTAHDGLDLGGILRGEDLAEAVDWLP